MNLPIEKSESNVNCGKKDDQRKDVDDYLTTTMITNDPIDDNNNNQSKKGKKMIANDSVNGDVINMITDVNHESDEGDEMEEEDDLLSSSMGRTSSRQHERLSTSLIADDEEASGHSGITQGYYELDERRTKKRRKQSNPVRYGTTGLLTKTPSSRPFKNPGEDYEDDDLSRDQTDNFVHNSNNEESMIVDDNSSSVLRMTIGRSSTVHRANALKRRFGKSSCVDDGEETEEDADQEEEEVEEDEDEGMDEPFEGDEDDNEPGQMDLSVAAAAAAAAALNYSQLTKFHFLCPHCGCSFINEDQLKDHIEEEHVQKVLEQQLLHHQQQQQQLDSQHQQQYKKTLNGISSRHEPKHGPFIDGPVSRGQQQQTRSRLSSSNRDVDADAASSLGDSCSNSPLGSPNCRQKTFDSSSLGSNNDHHPHHSHSQHHHSSSLSHHSTSHHKSSSKHSMTITGVSGTNNKNSGANSSTAGVTPVPSGSAKDFATLLSYKLHGVSGQQSTPTTSSSSPSTGNHHSHHTPSTTSQLPVPHSSASQSGQLNCDDNSSNNNGKDNNNNTNSSSNVMPIAMFPYLFNILPGSNGSNCSNNSTTGNNNNLNGSLVGGNGAGVNLTSGAIHNGLGLAGLTAINPANVHQKIFNPEAYCELCNKELCNKYFLKTHKANKHGIYTSDPSPNSNGPGGASSTVGAGSGSQAAQAAAVAAAFNTAAAAAYFQSASGIPGGSAQAAAAMQMQQLLQQASASSGSNGGPGGNGSGSASGTPNIDSSNAAAIVALANRSVGMINMESYCDICQKQFCNKYFLKKHRSKIHNIHCSSSSSTSSISGNNNNPLMLTGPGFHGSSDHSVTSLANLTGLALTAGSSSLDRNISNRSVSPSDSSGQGGDSNGLTEAISLVSTKVPLSSPQLSPSSSMDHRSTPLTSKHIINDNNSQTGPLKMTASLSSTTTTTTTTITTGNNLVSNERDRLSSKQVIPSSIQSSSVNSSPSSSPSTTITTVSTSNCLPNNSNNSSNCETYCDLCRTDLGNPMTLQAHRMIIHSIQGSPTSSWTRDQWQAMMNSLQAESFALLGRPINIPPGSAGENIIFTPEKLREMGVINADAFCEICKKEFCNKYFLRTHKANKHGIGTMDTASNCGSTKSNTSAHKGEGKEDGSHREERMGSGERGARIPHDFSYSERQSMSCPEDNTMSPRSSANEDSNQRRPSPPNSPTDLIFTSSSHVTITPTTPTGDALRSSSVSPPRTSSSPQVTLSAVNTSSNQGNNNNNAVSPGNGIPMTINSDCELICEICGKNFQSKSSLRAHRINIHGIRNNNCLSGRSGSSSTNNFTSNRRDNDNKSPESPKNCLSGNNNTSQVSAAAFALTGRQFGMEGLMSVGPAGGANSSGSSRPSGNCRNYCKICNKELCNKYFMKTHMKKMHQIDIDEHSAEVGSTASVGGVTCDICQKELCSKYFLKVHKQNTHGIGEDTPSGMKDGSRGGLSAITGPGMNLMIPGASGLGANLSNNVLTTSSSSSPLGSHHHHHQTGGSATNSGVDASGKRGDVNRGIVGMDGVIDCSSGFASDTENSVGIDPSDTGNRYFSHYTEVCPLCERRFKSIKWLKTHMTNDHSDLIPIRPTGNGSSSSSTFPTLNNAELTASAFLSGHDLNRMCVMCGQVCSDRSSLQMHLIKDHKTSTEELAALTGSNLFGLSSFNDFAVEATDLSSPINKSSITNNSSSNNNNNSKNNTRNINNTNSNSNDNSNEMKPMSPSSPPSASHETSSLPDNLVNQLRGPSVHKHDPMETVKEEVVTLSQTLQAARTRMKELRHDLEREKNAHAMTKDKLAQHGSELNNLRNSLQLVIEQQRLEVKTLQAKLKELDADLQNRHMALQRMEKENINLKLALQQMDAQKSNLENLPLLHNEIDRLRAELSQTETHAHAVQQTNDELLRNIDKLSEQFTE